VVSDLFEGVDSFKESIACISSDMDNIACSSSDMDNIACISSDMDNIACSDKPLVEGSGCGALGTSISDAAGRPLQLASGAAGGSWLLEAAGARVLAASRLLAAGAFSLVNCRLLGVVANFPVSSDFFRSSSISLDMPKDCWTRMAGGGAEAGVGSRGAVTGVDFTSLRRASMSLEI